MLQFNEFNKFICGFPQLCTQLIAMLHTEFVFRHKHIQALENMTFSINILFIIDLFIISLYVVTTALVDEVNHLY